MLSSPSLPRTASLRFQPTKRPQLSNQKTKTKPTLPKAAPPPPASNSAALAAAPPKSTLADWAATEDDDYGYMGEKRQRGGRKKRKKNREEHAVPQNWDDIYDPSRPNNYDAYRHSDEKILEVRDWKDRLYAHRMRRSMSRDSDSDDYDRPMNSMIESDTKHSISMVLTNFQIGSLLRAVLRRRRISTMCPLPLQLQFPMIHLEKTRLPAVPAWANLLVPTSSQYHRLLPKNPRLPCRMTQQATMHICAASRELRTSLQLGLHRLHLHVLSILFNPALLPYLARLFATRYLHHQKKSRPRKQNWKRYLPRSNRRKATVSLQKMHPALFAPARRDSQSDCCPSMAGPRDQGWVLQAKVLSSLCRSKLRSRRNGLIPRVEALRLPLDGVQSLVAKGRVVRIRANLVL